MTLTPFSNELFWSINLIFLLLSKHVFFFTFTPADSSLSEFLLVLAWTLTPYRLQFSENRQITHREHETHLELCTFRSSNLPFANHVTTITATCCPTCSGLRTAKNVPAKKQRIKVKAFLGALLKSWTVTLEHLSASFVNFVNKSCAKPVCHGLRSRL